MDMDSVALVIVAAGWLVILTCSGYVLLRTRLSPRYAAQRKQRADVKYDRRAEARRKRAASKEARLQKWAEENPDDPAAKAVLAKRPLLSVFASSDAEQDPAETLRQRQQDDDEIARRLEDRKAAAVLLNQQLLEWAMANPSAPAGKRHLVETLAEAEEEVERANQAIRFAGYLSDEERGSKMSEAEARRAKAQQTVDGIHAVLTPATDNQ